MALNLSGRGGELRNGSRQVARLATWTKDAARIVFTVEYVNAFAAGLGPPTHITIPVSLRVQRTYPIVSGGIEDGVVKVDLMHAASVAVEGNSV